MISLLIKNIGLKKKAIYCGVCHLKFDPNALNLLQDMYYNHEATNNYLNNKKLTLQKNVNNYNQTYHEQKPPIPMNKKDYYQTYYQQELDNQYEQNEHSNQQNTNNYLNSNNYNQSHSH